MIDKENKKKQNNKKQKQTNQKKNKTKKQKKKTKKKQTEKLRGERKLCKKKNNIIYAIYNFHTLSEHHNNLCPRKGTHRSLDSSVGRVSDF